MNKNKKLAKLPNSKNGLNKMAESMLKPLVKELHYGPSILTLFQKYPALVKFVLCVKCHMAEFDHDKAMAPGDEHPFMKSNLDYLAWKYETKKK